MKSAVEISHAFLKPALHKQAVCLDATMGNGKDTRFFLNQGVRKVVAFEIQPNVFQKTVNEIKDTRLEAYCLSHIFIKDKINTLLDAAIFNFGYCPGSDSGITTQADSSLDAVKQALDCLKIKGRMVLVMYSHEEGIKEAEWISSYLSGLDSFFYSVWMLKPMNAHNSPWIIAIEKNH